MTARRLVPAVVLLGALLLQAAWVLVVPPFRGYDELDHAYRAAAVAHGEWIAHGTASNGRGGLVTVPADLVDAGRRQCVSLGNMGRDNCYPLHSDRPGMVRVTSAASRYNPVFYWVVGTAGRPFHGVGSLYAMRLAASLMCAVGLAVAAWCLERRRRGRWPLAGLVLALSPVLLYSTTTPAPNGLEMVAGLVLWSSLLSLGAPPAEGDRLALGCAVAAAALLVTLRSLGPLFALCIVVCVVVARRRELAALWRGHARGLLIGAVVTVACGVASLWWIVVQAPLGTTADGDPSTLSYWSLVDVVPVGILQSVAAAPLVATSPPPVVYIVYLTLLLAVLVVALRASVSGARRALVLAVALTQLVPLAVSAAGLHRVGLVWQGRYALPFTAGVVVLAAVLLDRSGRSVLARVPLLVAGAGWGLAQLLTCLTELRIELARPVSAGDPGWSHGPTTLVVVVAVLGIAALVSAPLLAPTGSAPAGPSTAPRSRGALGPPVAQGVT